MKDFKYYVIFLIALLIFIYVAAFMPAIPLLENHESDLWYADASEQTYFYEHGIDNINILQEKYKGKIEFGEMKANLTIAMGYLESMYEDYENTREVYGNSRTILFEDLGIESYIEFDLLYNAQEKIFTNKPKLKIETVKIEEESIQPYSDGIRFCVKVVYTDSTEQILNVDWYNEEKLLDNTNNSVKSTFKILPKVEG